MWKSVYGYAGILGLDILLLSDIQGWPRVHTRWLRSPTLDKDYFCIVSTVISVLTDTLLKRTPRVSPCILLLLLVYLNKLDICLWALSICQNWPAALLPDQSVNEFENDIGFSKSFCWKTISFVHAIILGFDWRSEVFDRNGLAGQFWTHSANPKGVRHRGSGVRRVGKSTPSPASSFAHATSGHSCKAFVIKSAYDALL